MLANWVMLSSTSIVLIGFVVSLIDQEIMGLFLEVCVCVCVSVLLSFCVFTCLSACFFWVTGAEWSYFWRMNTHGSVFLWVRPCVCKPRSSACFFSFKEMISRGSVFVCVCVSTYWSVCGGLWDRERARETEASFKFERKIWCCLHVLVW